MKQKTSNITVTPIRLVYSNPIKGFLVLGCRVDENDAENPVILNKFNNITISGCNLHDFTIGQSISVRVRENQKSTYEASYVVVGFPGIDESGERITVDASMEYDILNRYMTSGQARNVNEAYPHFIEMILNGEEAKIDYNKIYNVGPKRMEEYIDKVKSCYRTILFLPICGEYLIEDENVVNHIATIYTTPEQFKAQMEKNPYQIYIGVAGFSFNKTDKLVLEKFPNLIDSPQRCEYAIREICEQNELEGDTRLNANYMARFVAELVPECKQHIHDVALSSPLFYYDETSKNFSLLETYVAECNIADAIVERVKNPYTEEDSTKITTIDGAEVSTKVHTPITMHWEDFVEVDGFKCTEEQCEALKMITHNRACIVSGSAGTGKSTWLKATVRMLEANGFTYLLLAPTGKAAGRMRETTGRDASTIHMALANNRNCNGEYISSYDYIIIDEFSMVGVKLLSQLIDSLHFHNNLVFVCDEAQLASISAGNIIQDLLDSEVIPCVRFTKVFRYGIGGISTIATDIRMGEYKGYDTSFPDLHMYPTDTDEILATVNKLYKEYLDQGYTKDDIMILCPFNKSPIGCYAINNQIQQAFNHNRPSKIGYKPIPSASISFAKGDRVICTHNNYRTPSMEFDENGNLMKNQVAYTAEGESYVEDFPPIPVMNGDIGYILHIDDSSDTYSMAIQYESGIAYISGQSILQTQLGYAMSIHKSQGSQAKAVIMVIDPMHMKMLSRNLLYVGVSRASESLSIVGRLSMIPEAIEIQENKNRDTWLKELLIKANSIFPDRLDIPSQFSYHRSDENSLEDCVGDTE